MADEQILMLLREIRDSQNAYIELYKDAVKNQQSSIDLQKQCIRRQKLSLSIYVIFVVLFVVGVFLFLR